MNPLRASVALMTDHGLLLVGDSYKDFHRVTVLKELEEKRQNALRRREHTQATRYLLGQSLVIEQGRLALDGGKVEPQDYQEADVDRVIDVESSRFHKELETIMRVIRVTIAREVDEELALAVDPESVKFLKRIIGRNRNHIICTAYAQGRIKMNHAEILGLGMLTDKLPATPQNHIFYQRHVRQFRSSYLSNAEEYEAIKKMPVSRINVSQSLVYDLFRHQCAGYAYARGSINFDKREIPVMPKSTENFVIYNEKGSSVDPEPIFSKEVSPEYLIEEMRTKAEYIGGLRKAKAPELITVEPKAPLNQQVKVPAGRKR